MLAPLPPKRPKVVWEPVTLEECTRWVEDYNRWCDSYWAAVRARERLPEWEGYMPTQTPYGLAVLSFRSPGDGRLIALKFNNWRHGYSNRRRARMADLEWAGAAVPRESRRRARALPEEW